MKKKEKRKSKSRERGALPLRRGAQTPAFLRDFMKTPKNPLSREQVRETIAREKLIVILRGVERDKLLLLADALYAGGVRAVEITFSATGAPSDAETAEQIAALVRHIGDRMRIGAGTVLTARQVSLAARAGAGFIVSPNTDPAVIRKTRACSLVSIPGALTATEAQAAYAAGADFVKIFPVSAFGPSYIRALKAPLPHIPMIAVNGVPLDRIPDYLAAGADGFAIGGAIAERDALAPRL